LDEVASFWDPRIALPLALSRASPAYNNVSCNWHKSVCFHGTDISRAVSWRNPAVLDNPGKDYAWCYGGHGNRYLSLPWLFFALFLFFDALL